MKLTLLFALLSSTALCSPFSERASAPSVTDSSTHIIYRGKSANNVESFLNIRFGQHTGGANRFLHPKPFSYPDSTVVDASAPGAACPQQKQPVPGFDVFDNVTNVSEDCLTLRVDRPAGTGAGDKLPVFVWIFGGGDSIGQIYDSAYDPTGLITNSVNQKTPIIYVAMNYRLGVFGFAATPALNASNNLNSGLMDQWLALNWIQKHISSFGGDPTKVTIAGESDGATNVGLHITAYGGDTDYPFQQAIMESGATTADVDITNGYSANNTAAVVQALNCTSPTQDSKAEMSCLRALPLDILLNTAVLYEYSQDELSFDVFKPSSPDPFIPDAPSHLLSSGRFRHNTNILTGWNENDGSLFAPPPANISTDADFRAFVKSTFPGLTQGNFQTLLDLYPTTDYTSDPAENVTAQFFRAAAVQRDQGMTCPSLLIVDSMAAHSKFNTSAYLYALNASDFTSFFEQAESTYLGVSHFSDIPFVFGQVDSGPLATLSDHVSGSWAAFATHGNPSRVQKLDGWLAADRGGKTDVDKYNIRILGGPKAGQDFISSKNGSRGYGENVVKKCDFWNSKDVLDQVGT
ncbi:hypothetical protein H2200_009865 [Cladophialophora chaetospira]|uniref:Carboxylesterase type B domain-containing protein n=1 Tax=Cladophialophora chaetospira TaxID=386627 RepID=A0AA38X386_9EURO|nr:hypothetical protein H2200_009865 [Cladophialophora chaetospira]